MKRLLITGSSGMLGSNMVFELKGKYDIIGLYKSRPNPMLKSQFKLDLTEKDNVISFIGKVKPDIVIHCAALTNVDICEQDYRIAHKTNTLSTEYLLSNLAPHTKFVYISTDSIFDGTKGNYSESDKPNPLNNYAKSKLEGEKVAEEMSKNYLIIRTNIFGWNLVSGLSFAEWIFENLKNRKPIRMFTDIIFSPVLANTLSLLIDILIEKDFIGKLNIGTENPTCKYDFGIELADSCGLSKASITPVSVDTFNFKARRPKNTSLDVSKAKKIFGALPKIENEIRKFCDKRKIKYETIHRN